MQLREIAPGKRLRHVGRPLAGGAAAPFRVHFETFDEIDAGSGHFVRAHRHLQFEIFRIDQGEYRCSVDGQGLRVTPGHILMVRPDSIHEDACHEAVRFRALRLRLLPGPSPERSADIFADEAPVTAQVVADEGGRLSAILDRIASEEVSRGRFATEFLDLLATEFVWEVARSLPPEVLAPRLIEHLEERGFAGALHRLFEQHVGETLGLRDMAAALEMSERTVSARCRALFQESPTRLFVRHKMDRARMLLAQTDLPIKEISAHLGFENPYHFSTVYKRVFGVAPTGHR